METQRHYRHFNVELRTAPDGVTEIHGCAVRYNDPAHGEMIAPGAFAKTISEQDVKLYWSHKSDMVLGRVGNGTLILDDKEDGLYVTGRPNPDTSWGRDALASIARGDVFQFSFAFAPVAQDNTIDADGNSLTVVREARLYEVSPVAEPWYETTSAAARDSGGRELERDLQSRLRVARLRLRLAKTRK